jgi:hypothetical protein
MLDEVNDDSILKTGRFPPLPTISALGIALSTSPTAPLSRSDLVLCGEHGGDPTSVALCHEIALDYVSCSPFRVPIARLAAAQAALGKGPAGEA